ncbi:hypothetical protein BDV93DRAFT_523031 [Ceratobasidium sp. AG-I]|nr:hypothetical protein BDV93DRAFT_523031 [Ceratobasidium sp. AG-I]
MASTVILGATSYDSLDSSWSERMKSTDEAPKPMSLTLLAQTTPEKFEVEAVVKVESDVKVEDVEGNDLIRAFGTLTVETKTEIPPEANGNNSAKDEDDNDLLRPPSPKRKSVVIIRSGTPERFRDEHLYLVARSWDSKYRIYHWNIRNQGSSFVSYVDPSDRLNDRSCVAWICEYGIQDFLIGPDLYRSNYQTSTLSKCEFGSKEFRPVDLWSDNLEQAMRYYQSLAPALHPDALVPHDPKGDCQLINLSDPDNPEDLWCHLMNMLNPQPPTETNGLRDVLENGIPGVATAMPSPGSSDEAFDASVLTPTSDDPQSSQKMILPEGKQTIAELEIFVKKVETKLKELSGKRRVECPKCGKSPCDSKYTTLMVRIKYPLDLWLIEFGAEQRHILPHLHGFCQPMRATPAREGLRTNPICGGMSEISMERNDVIHVVPILQATGNC